MFCNGVAKTVGFYNGEVIAIDINTNDAIVLMRNDRGQIDIDAGKNAPTFAVLVKSKGDCFAVLFVSRVFGEKEVSSGLGALNCGGDCFVAIGKAYVLDQ